MAQPRVIPVLLLRRGGLVKTIGFEKPAYVGDPINAVRIFNEKEVDELVLLDIEASGTGVEPKYADIEEVVSEAFMPIAYGGGVRSVEQARRLVGLGVEKIVLNTAVLERPELMRAVADQLGSSSAVVSINVKKDWRGRYRVYDSARRTNTGHDLLEHARRCVAEGAGEVFINDVVRDGTGKGYDLDLIRAVAESVDVPVIACGGAGSLEDFTAAVAAGASAVAAGSMFVYMGRHRAVMINYPGEKILREMFASV
jgi:cyclase